jgi:Flp pilus assembly protein TadB
MPLHISFHSPAGLPGSTQNGGKLQRFKAIAVAFLILCAAVGVLIAAFTVGLIISIVLLASIVVALCIGFVSYIWRGRKRRRPRVNRHDRGEVS